MRWFQPNRRWYFVSRALVEGGVIKFILLSLFPNNLNTTLHLIVESYTYKINWREFGYDSSMLATERCAFNYRLNAALSSSRLSSSSNSLRVSLLPPRERYSTIAPHYSPLRKTRREDPLWTLNNSQTLLENVLMKSIEWMLMVPYYLLTQAEQKPDITGVLLIPCLLLAQAGQRPDFTGDYWSLDKRQISCSLIRYWGTGRWTKARLYG